jgi:hypothetical protein
MHIPLEPQICADAHRPARKPQECLSLRTEGPTPAENPADGRTSCLILGTVAGRIRQSKRAMARFARRRIIMQRGVRGTDLMAASFVAYIDESGDEGFKFRTSVNEEASSDWFVIAAFVTRKKTDLEVVKAIDLVRQELKLHARKHVHWKKLKHAEKVRYSQIVAGLHARVIGVCVHKPLLLEPETLQDRYRLYLYAVRYLLERFSWLARDRYNRGRWGGDGTVELLFSNRQGMSYDEMWDYLRLLEKKQETGLDIRIEFAHVPVAKLRTLKN